MERLLFDADSAEQWLTERELIVERPIKVPNTVSKLNVCFRVHVMFAHKDPCSLHAVPFPSFVAVLSTNSAERRQNSVQRSHFARSFKKRQIFDVTKKSKYERIVML